MSNDDIAKNFRSFGNKMIPMGIFSILTFISLVIAIIFPGLLLNIGILIFIFIFRLVSMIIIFIALVNIKNINRDLNNTELNDFRTGIITAFILGLIAYICYVVAFSFLSAFIRTTHPPFLVIFILFLIGAIICSIVYAVFNIQAWGDIESFFQFKSPMLESNIGNTSKSGAFLCKLGAYFYITFVLLFIGELLFAIGYFLLIRLRDVKEVKDMKTPGPATHPPPPQRKYIALLKRFCPNCGAAIQGKPQYCSQCGTELDNF